MDYLWRVLLALFGLLLLQGFFYPRSWGRRRLLNWLLAVLGIELTVPLIIYTRTGLFIGLVSALFLLMPYQRMAIAYLKSRTRAGLRRIAQRWATELKEDPETGLWEVAKEVAGKRAWVGNVLTHMRSIDPRVKKSQSRYMLAFVIELDAEPAFQCSLMVGWDGPRYFEREWRSTHVIHGGHLSLAMGDLIGGGEKGRSTGGRAKDLEPYSGLPKDRVHQFQAIGIHEREFARVFTAQFVDRFFKVASQTHPYELNVTPSSVNIYTTYCDSEAQEANIEFLEELVARLEPTTKPQG